MPVQNELSEQNIKDRYYGINDPVANKMLRRVSEQPKLEPPEDNTITSLYVGGVTPDITEEDLKDTFYTFGELAGVRKVASRFCAFVTFTERAAAEKAAEALHNKLIIKGIRLRLMWGRPQQNRQQQQQEHDPMQPVQSNRAAAGQGQGGSSNPNNPAGNYFGLAPSLQGGVAQYPSMDPTAMGARIPAPKRPDDSHSEEAAKRQRADGQDQSSSGYGYMPPPGMPPSGYAGGPPHVMAPPAMGMMPPRPMMPPMPVGMPPMGMPPPVMPRPPPGMMAPPGGPVMPPQPPMGRPPMPLAAAAAGGLGITPSQQLAGPAT
eukprot:GHRR01021379.1.p1 GENE.GHRR01021379.1~~GHRR01021379.1.p1  ORF type:complete len:319 (+),score=102.46 GHRR01021379.1:179-1135(+)